MSNNPYDAIGPRTWIKGMWLGFLLIFLFTLGAGLAFGLLRLLGADMANSVVLGAILGPVIGTVIFAVYWKWTQAPTDAA
jgi:hypothetical protein